MKYGTLRKNYWYTKVDSLPYMSVTLETSQSERSETRVASSSDITSNTVDSGEYVLENYRNWVQYIDRKVDSHSPMLVTAETFQVDGSDTSGQNALSGHMNANAGETYMKSAAENKA